MVDFKTKTKAEMLEDYIVKEILPKHLPGSKMLSELAMAKKFNASRTTIHKVFSNLTAKGLLYRENGLGTFVSKPKPKKQNTKIITAICASDTWHNPSQHASWFNTEFLLNGFSKAINGHNYLLNTLYLDPDAQSVQEGVKIIADTKADGFIFPGLGGYDEHIKELAKQGKIAVCRSSFPYHHCHSVYLDFYDAFYDAMNYLIENGRKKIAILGHDHEFNDLKLKGALKAIKDHGLDPANLIYIYPEEDGFELDGYRAVNKFFLKNKDIDALLCVTDRLAFGAHMAIRDIGLKIPDDIAIIGSDDIPGCLKFEPPLASITSEFYKIGELMFDIVVKEMNHQHTELVEQAIKVKFVPRESCGFIDKK